MSPFIVRIPAAGLRSRPPLSKLSASSSRPCGYSCCCRWRGILCSYAVFLAPPHRRVPRASSPASVPPLLLQDGKASHSGGRTQAPACRGDGRGRTCGLCATPLALLPLATPHHSIPPRPAPQGREAASEARKRIEEENKILRQEIKEESRRLREQAEAEAAAELERRVELIRSVTYGFSNRMFPIECRP